jgi:hypothetical protein
MLKRILFLTPPAEDYLTVMLLHGLRALPEIEVVDWPRYAVAYRDYPSERRASVYGRGFTAFFNMVEPISIDRTNIEGRLRSGEFDLVVVSDIWRSFEGFARWQSLLKRTITIVVDGADTPQVYPSAGRWWRKPSFWLLPKPTGGLLYFKREWTEDSRFNLWHRIVPRTIRRRIPHYRGLHPISFSIPAEKIVGELPCKSQDFPRHIVDAEVADRLSGSSGKYAFASEADYYADLGSSRFGITKKRSGWDCLRHYEIAGNGCVPCFRNLEAKPETCAPHGLEPGVNCLSYRDADDLFAQIEHITSEIYLRLANGALKWANQNTTKKAAKRLLDEILAAHAATSK